MKVIFVVMNTTRAVAYRCCVLPYRPESFSGLIFTTAQVVFITVKITSIVQIYDFYIFTVVYSTLHGFILNQHNDQLPIGLLAQLVERCTSITEVMGSNPLQA